MLSAFFASGVVIRICVVCVCVYGYVCNCTCACMYACVLWRAWYNSRQFRVGPDEFIISWFLWVRNGRRAQMDRYHLWSPTRLHANVGWNFILLKA